jgi:hypothetical protein
LSAQVQAFSVLVNHFVELVAPWFLLSPWAPLRHAAGVCQVLFQILLIASGNLSFLNWLTIVPALACFDDEFAGWRLCFSRRTRERATAAYATSDSDSDAAPAGSVQSAAAGAAGEQSAAPGSSSVASTAAAPPPKDPAAALSPIPSDRQEVPSVWWRRVRLAIQTAFVLLVAYLSIDPVANLLSRSQVPLPCVFVSTLFAGRVGL